MIDIKKIREETTERRGYLIAVNVARIEQAIKNAAGQGCGSVSVSIDQNVASSVMMKFKEAGFVTELQKIDGSIHTFLVAWLQ